MKRNVDYQKNASFEEELEARLNGIKNSYHKSDKKTMKNQQMAQILDQVVIQLQNTNQYEQKKEQKKKKNDKGHFEKEKYTIHEKKTKQNHNFAGKEEKENSRDVNLFNVWNIFTDEKIVQFFKLNFSNKGQQEQIHLIDFVDAIYMHFANIKLTHKESFDIKQKMQIQLTTTNKDILSLNALQILSKKGRLIQYLVHKIIEVRSQILYDEIVVKNRVSKKQLQKRQQKLNERVAIIQQNYDQICKRQTHLLVKEKQLTARQKQLITKEKQLKKSIEQKSIKIYESYVTQFSEKVKQGQKKLANLQKNIRYKIQILEKRAQNIKTLMSDYHEMKNKKIIGDNETKIRLKKIEKQYQNYKKQQKQFIEKYQKEQKQLLKSVSLLEQKNNKADLKIRKQKQKVKQLEQETTELKQENKILSSQNSKLIQALKEISQKQGQQIQLKPLKQSKTSRPKKKSQKNNSLLFIVPLYEDILAGENKQQSLFEIQKRSNSILTIILQNLPHLINLVCGQEDSSLNSIPYQLSMKIVKVLSKLFIKKIQQTQQNKQIQFSKNITKVWSKSFSQLTKMPFEAQIRNCLFFLLMPIVDWSQSDASLFFISTMQKILALKQDQLTFQNSSNMVYQLNFISSNEFLSYITMFFLSCIEFQQISSQLIINDLKNCISVIDLLIFELIKSEKKSRSQFNSSKTVFLFLFTKLTHVTKQIINLYNEEGKSKQKKIKALFLNLQYIQELAEKLSILLQRYCHNQLNQKLDTFNQRELQRLYKQLLQCQRCGTQRFSMLTANIRSMIESF